MNATNSAANADEVRKVIIPNILKDGSVDREAVLRSSYVLHPTHLLVSKLKEMIAVAG